MTRHRKPRPTPEDAALAERAQADTTALLTRASRFVADRSDRWRTCPRRQCRRACACTGSAGPETHPPCADANDREDAVMIVIFSALEQARTALEALPPELRAPE